MPVSPTVGVAPGPGTLPISSIDHLPVEEYTLAVIVTDDLLGHRLRISLYKSVDGLLKGATDLFNGSLPTTLKPGKYFLTLPGGGV